jgi:hypothetical protein
VNLLYPFENQLFGTSREAAAAPTDTLICKLPPGAVPHLLRFPVYLRLLIDCAWDRQYSAQSSVLE